MVSCSCCWFLLVWVILSLLMWCVVVVWYVMVCRMLVVSLISLFVGFLRRWCVRLVSRVNWCWCRVVSSIVVVFFLVVLLIMVWVWFCCIWVCVVIFFVSRVVCALMM